MQTVLVAVLAAAAALPASLQLVAGAAGIETGAGGKVGAGGYEGASLPPPPQAVRATIANNGIRRDVDMGLERNRPLI
ncbi:MULTISPECIES: hypothetical protein [unclassified Rhizobacter]|uniref:hypothetical protein n=1 Tax=unclassified Rhizobacter TaxID=2640088 RepID=UPI00138EFEAC|nr:MULTISPECIES: hypothetical protein [unclassified Rhizobacter]